MSFREALRAIVDQTPGGLAAVLMGSDGIAVDEYSRRRGELDLSAVAVEFQRVLEQARLVAAGLYGRAASQPAELVLVTGQHQLLFRQLDEEYFIVLALDPAGLLGKARYLVGNTLDSLRAEL